jgi:putative transposase
MNPGKLPNTIWSEIPLHFPHVELDAFVIMPNHLHGIIITNNILTNVGAKNFSPLHQPQPHSHLSGKSHSPSKTIGSIVRGFKIGVTKWFRNNSDIHTVWQRNYYDRLIRNEAELNSIREYIASNPWNWESDENYMV